MRIVAILFVLVIFGYGNSNLIDNIDQKLEKVEQISKKQTYTPIHIHYDPFYTQDLSKKQQKSPQKNKQILEHTSQTKHKKLILSSIFDRKAFINLKWYKENQKIYDYTVIKINKNSVFLANKNKIIVLRLTPSIKLLSIKDESK